jgi:hypothetical protein
MSSVSTETIPNRPLSGVELRKIIVADVDYILGRDGMFGEHLGFGRVTYDIVIKLHLDNPAYPEHLSPIRSRKQPDQNPVIEPAPLKDPSKEAVLVGKKATRTIDSPNVERIKRGMPVTQNVRSRETGKIEEKQVTYDAAILSGGSEIPADPLAEGLTESELKPGDGADWGV